MTKLTNEELDVLEIRARDDRLSAMIVGSEVRSLISQAREANRLREENARLRQERERFAEKGGLIRDMTTCLENRNAEIASLRARAAMAEEIAVRVEKSWENASSETQMWLMRWRALTGDKTR